MPRPGRRQVQVHAVGFHWRRLSRRLAEASHTHLFSSCWQHSGWPGPCSCQWAGPPRRTRLS
eukprot:1071558-Rhodomonas_salina.3